MAATGIRTEGWHAPCNPKVDPVFAPDEFTMTIRSYDVFDTCLARRVGVPTDAVPLVARRLASVLGLDPTPGFIAEVTWARLQGERRSRGESWQIQATLDDIWREAEALLGWAPSPAHVATELAVEEELLFPVPALLEEVTEARRQGHRIIYVTDTYFPESFLRRVLSAHGFLRPEDGLYISNVLGESKAGGGLFPHVVAKEAGPPSRIVHTGDSRRSDEQQARNAGLTARWIDPTALNRIESSIAASRDLPPEATSCWVAALREARLVGSHPPAPTPGAILGSSFAAPFLFAFVAWVLAEARRDGVERLYFASRDGRIASEVARSLASEFGDPDIRYLRISRQSLLLPSATEISPRGMPWMRRSWEKQEVRRLLSKVDLEVHDHPEAWAPLVQDRGEEFELTTDDHWERFWKILSGSQVGPALQTRIEERRTAALAFLRAEGLLEPGRRALVDFGWSFSSQAALNALLRQAGGGVDPVRGYYLEAGAQRASRGQVGPVQALFWPVPPDRARLVGSRTPRTFAPVLEHTLGLADHPSVHHYEFDGNGGVTPCGASGPLITTAGEFFSTVLARSLDFADRNRSRVHHMVPEAGVARGILQRFVDELLAHPPKDLVREVAHLRGSDHQDHRGDRPLVRPLTIREEALRLLPIPPPPRVVGVDNPPWWKEGSQILTPPWVLRGRGLIALLHPPADRLWSALAQRIPKGWSRRVRHTLGWIADFVLRPSRDPSPRPAAGPGQDTSS